MTAGGKIDLCFCLSPKIAALCRHLQRETKTKLKRT